MLDTKGRNINYLRISITDRCNLRCLYCMPLEGVEKLGHFSILNLEDIARLVRVAATVGIRKIRLTGGEPLVRKNVAQLIHYIHEIKEIDDISLTTNGTLFAGMAEELQAAGLDRVNFSLDTLVADKFKYITREGKLPEVRQAIDKALALGMEPVKINTVLIRGFNDNEVMDFADLAYNNPLHIRFIEFMPIGDLQFWNRENIVTSSETRNLINKKYKLVDGKKVRGSGPAKYYKLEGGQGSVGFISPMSNHFCAECNRIRMTAEGKLRGCLYDKTESDLKQALENGASDEELRQIFLMTINAKPDKHNMNSGWGDENLRKMYQIGG
ncbi:MAG: GTP 3',8-cyclase MoaA [Firmicutes bacterium]|nr:GTP 3',8-cyclase MoaA [Bacillota bacterium]